MNIKDDHFYHGAVLIQIAEHNKFTAINALQVKGKTSHSAFKVNGDIAVYLKYASEPKPTGAFEEYAFNFNKQQLEEVDAINDEGNDLYLALVCVEAREVCCFPYDEFLHLITHRRVADLYRRVIAEPERAAAVAGEQYTLAVTLKPREWFRVNVKAPGRKKTYLTPPIKVPRNNCPNALFRD